MPGTDYTATSGSVTFPAGSTSATVESFTVQTTGGTPPGEAKTIVVTLSADGADLIGAQPTVVINAHGLPYLNNKLSIASQARRSDVTDDHRGQGRPDDPGRTRRGR